MDITYKLNEIKEAATQFWSAAADKRVFAFHGNMGSGKTTFIHALCDVKGVKDVVGSPTFSIINEYLIEQNELVKKVYHIDLYRLKDEEEAMQAGVEDCLYSDHICFIEWPEKALHILPQETVHADIVIVDDQTRRVTF